MSAPNVYTPVIPIAPFYQFTEFTPAVPDLYWNVYSAEERMKKLCMEMHKIIEYANALGIAINTDHDIINELEVSWTKLLGDGYIPQFADPLEWDDSTAYAPLTIVTYHGNSYTSRQYVPAGTSLDDSDYWVETGNFNAQLEDYRQRVIGVEEDMNTLNDIIPVTSFDDENTVKAYIDALAALLPNTSFDASNTVKDYIDTGNTALEAMTDKRAVVFDTVSDMQEATNLKANMICHTNGFHSAGDGGAAWYKVSDSGTANEMDVISLQNSLLATLIITEDYVTPEMFGAYGDGVHDDTDLLQAVLDTSYNISFGYKKTYLVRDTISIAVGRRTIEGNLSVIKLDSGYDVDICEIESTGLYTQINNLTFEGNESNENGIVLKHNVVSLMFNKVVCRNNGKSGVYLEQQSYGHQFTECNFTKNGEHGFNASDGNGQNLFTTDFLMCRFTRNGISGITISGSTNKFFGGWIEENKIGVIIDASTNNCGNIDFFGVDFETNSDNTFKFYSTNNQKIISNIRIIGGQIYAPNTNQSVFIFDAPAYYAISNIYIRTSFTVATGYISSSTNRLYIYTDKYPYEKIDGNNIFIYKNVDVAYVTDSAAVNGFIASKPTYSNNNWVYVIKPNEQISIDFNDGANCTEMKFTCTAGTLNVCFELLSNNNLNTFSQYNLTSDGVDDVVVSPYNFIKRGWITNTGSADITISSILFTGHLPINV